MSGNKWAKGQKVPGSGRKKGTPNKATRWKLTLKGESYLPLDFLLAVMRNTAAPKDLRFKAAVAAAPYCHRALKAVEHTGEGGVAIAIQITWLEPSE